MKSKITSLTLGNFKAFGTTQSIPVRPITLIFGANSAGKSSILQSLVFAHEASKPSGRRDASPLDVHKTQLGGDSIDLGGFDRYLHAAARQQLQPTATWGLKVDNSGAGQNDTLGNSWRLPSELEVHVQFGRLPTVVSYRGNTPVTSTRIRPASISICVNGQHLIDLKDPLSQDVTGFYRVTELNTRSNIFSALIDAAGEVASRGEIVPSIERQWIRDALSNPSPSFSWHSQEQRNEFAMALEAGIRQHFLLLDDTDGLLNFHGWDIGFIRDNLQDKPGVLLAIAHLSDAMENWVRSCAKALEGLSYLGPVRQVADRVLLSGVSESEAGDRSLGGAEYKALMQSPLLLSLANHWLERLGTGLKLEATTLIRMEDAPFASARPLEAFALIASWKGSFNDLIEGEESRRETSHSDVSDPEELADVLQVMRAGMQQLFEGIEPQAKDSGTRAGHGASLGSNNRHPDLASLVMAKFREMAVSDQPRSFSLISKGFEGTSEEKLGRMCEEYFLYLAKSWSQGNRKAVLIELARTFSFTPSEDESETALRQLILRDAATGQKLSFRDVGCGIAQCVPVIAMLTGMRERIVCIEQPELHLHPKLQSEIGDLLIESALGVNGNMVIAETHSEHLILRILRRLRETAEGRLPKGCAPITPDDVAILYVEKENGESKVRHIEVTRDGNFKSPWPGGFFEERLEELF